MGKKPAQLEREIADQRREMTRKREHIEDRVRGSVDDVKSTASELTRKSKLNEYINERPLTTMIAAFGTGMLLGVASETAPAAARTAGHGAQSAYDRAGGAGLLTGVLGTVTGPLGNTLQDELRTTLRDVLGRNDGHDGAQYHEGHRIEESEPLRKEAMQATPASGDGA